MYVLLLEISVFLRTSLGDKKQLLHSLKAPCNLKQEKNHFPPPTPPLLKKKKIKFPWITCKFGEITLTEKYPENLDGDEEGDTEDDTPLHASAHID